MVSTFGTGKPEQLLSCGSCRCLPYNNWGGRVESSLTSDITSSHSSANFRFLCFDKMKICVISAGISVLTKILS